VGACETGTLAGGNLEYIGRGCPGDRDVKLTPEAGLFGMTVSAERGAGETGVTGAVAGVAITTGRSVGGVSDILCLFLKRAMKPLRPGPAEAGGVGTEVLNLGWSEGPLEAGRFPVIEWNLAGS